MEERASGGSANIKFLTIHSLMKRSILLLPEAVNWAGERPRAEAKQVGTDPLHPQTDLPETQAGVGNHRLGVQADPGGSCALSLTSPSKLLSLSTSQFLLLEKGNAGHGTSPGKCGRLQCRKDVTFPAALLALSLVRID